MKALILVGGYGTRLRPLTEAVPKPLVPFANKAIILHQIESLALVGVKDVVLAVSYMADKMIQEMKQYENAYGVRIRFSLEDEQLGTAGPLALARSMLTETPGPFFVLNSDVICNYPFAEMAEFHASHGKEGTIVVTDVEDPSKYGVVVCEDESTQIKSFVEKPKVFVSRKINAGLYLFNQSVLDRVPDVRDMSIEKEVFPFAAADGQLHGFPLEGFWMDVGQPRDYLAAIPLYMKNITERRRKGLQLAVLDHEHEHNPAHYAGSRTGNIIVHPGTKVGKGSLLGPNVFIGENVTIGANVRIQNSAVFDGAKIHSGVSVADSIVGWNSSLESGCVVKNISVLGENVVLKENVTVDGGRVSSNSVVSADLPQTTPIC
ncbi:MAG: mannose-1-phosphate guanyltransferase [Amphiamblys sp. WSBS2006]|nr:MAG: mannose-1-phosphate guanyltransferase [Amphiamblys sp. WSBS2006]